LWARESFRWVTGGETLSLIGDSNFQIVLAWLVVTISGSPATLADVLVAAAIPRGVLMLLGRCHRSVVSPHGPAGVPPRPGWRC
jgi:hypothetical protein